MPDFRLLSQAKRSRIDRQVLVGGGFIEAVTGSQQRPVSARQNQVPILHMCALGTSGPCVDDVKHPTALVGHM